jgi:hypothetical protein
MKQITLYIFIFFAAQVVALHATVADPKQFLGYCFAGNVEDSCGDTPASARLKIAPAIWQLGKNNLSTLGACCRPLSQHTQQAPMTIRIYAILFVWRACSNAREELYFNKKNHIKHFFNYKNT